LLLLLRTLGTQNRHISEANVAPGPAIWTTSLECLKKKIEELRFLPFRFLNPTISLLAAGLSRSNDEGSISLGIKYSRLEKGRYKSKQSARGFIREGSFGVIKHFYCTGVSPRRNANNCTPQTHGLRM
jgi:hypothetical protein